MKSPQSFRLLGTLVLLAAVGCQAYDEHLLTARRVPTALPSPIDRVAGTGGGGAAGSGTAGTGTAAPAAGSGGSTSGVAGGTGAPRCGDGRVDSGESCDTGILPGMLGACPTVCEAPDSCERWTLRGSGCTTTCVATAILCIADDGCCPADCTGATDSDCSPICGDGIVQTARGETCESNPSAGGARCPSATDCDDADPCTLDAVGGSAANCTAVCTHDPVRTPRDADGCCPSGADAANDSDCGPRCGNGVREGSEECDGSSGCDSACKVMFTGPHAQCLERFGASDCESCQCENCTDEMLACRASGDASRDQDCAAVEQCAAQNDCAGDACYCGSSSFALGCALRPSGPCVRVIEAAAGSSLGLVVQAEYNDANSALGRARALGECRRRNCAAECN